MSDFDTRFAALQQRFKDLAKLQLAELETALAGQNWLTIRDVSHSLSGRAGMFGFAELGEIAQALEEAIDTNLPEANRSALCDQLLTMLRGVD